MSATSYCLVTIPSQQLPAGRSAARQRSGRCCLTQVRAQRLERMTAPFSLPAATLGVLALEVCQQGCAMLTPHLKSSFANKRARDTAVSAAWLTVLLEHGAEVTSFSCIIIKKAEVNPLCTVALPSSSSPPSPSSFTSRHIFTRKPRTCAAAKQAKEAEVGREG